MMEEKTVQYTPFSMVAGLVVFGFAAVGVQTVVKSIYTHLKKG